MPKPLHLLLLAALIVLGVWLRCSGLAWGGAARETIHPDEPRFIEQARALDHGEPLRKSYVFGFGQTIRLVHRVIPAADYIAIARILSVIAGLALCPVLYAIARALGLRSETALLAAALVSVNTLCVIHSHFGTADALYVTLVCCFAWCALLDRWLCAATLAGLAMAMKFGLILVPSLLLLAAAPLLRKEFSARAVLRLLAVPLVVGAVFLAAQGFTFDGESIRMISLSMKSENIGGFEHQKWTNLVTYSGVLLRALGLPVFIVVLLCVARCARPVPRIRSLTSNQVVAILPFIIHGIGLLAINTAFPRHALLLIPPALLAAARIIGELPRFRAVLAALCLLWSALLAWSDSLSFVSDSCQRVAAAVVADGRANLPTWADAAFWRSVPGHWKSAVNNSGQAKLLILSEGWTWRFTRSELNPLREPDEHQLYHATPAELRWFRDIRTAIADGHLQKFAEAGPLLLLPEQFVYDALWGSFEKFAGRCSAYVPAPSVPDSGKASP